MIQDIAPHQFDNTYRDRTAKDEDLLLFYRKGEIWGKWEENRVSFLTVGEYRKQVSGQKENWTYLFQIDQTGFYLGEEAPAEVFPAYSFAPTRALRTAAPGFLGFAGITGYQLYNWYQSRVYCGRCGGKMEKGTGERHMRCPVCRQTEYPKICPAVIVGILHEDKILLSKYSDRDFKRYALIAGFAEIGETIEETVKREVMEEVGLKVKNLRFYKSQPWSFSDTLLFGFYCDLDGEETITLDTKELSLAQWTKREDIPDEGENVSLTKEMMMRFKRGEKC